MQMASAQDLVVEMISGDETEYDMATVSKLILTSKGRMTVMKSDGTSDNFDLSTIRKVAFSPEDAQTAVEDAVAPSKPVLKVYPNPAKDEITVEGANDDILIFSANGGLLSTTKAADRAVINVSSLADGVYILRSGKSAARIIKTK